MNQFIYSIITFIIGIFFVLVGLVCLILPWFPAMQQTLIQFILEDVLAFSLFGAVLVLVGVALILYLVFNARRRYYYVRTEALSIAVDETLFRQYIAQYCKKLFPEKEIPYRMQLKRGKLYISFDFPPYPLEEQKPFLEKIKNELQALFLEKLGYRDQLYLYAAFQRGA